METLKTSTPWVQIAVQKSSSSGELSGDYAIYANLGRTCLIAPHLIFHYTKAKSQQSNHKYKYSLDIHIILTYNIYIYVYIYIFILILQTTAPALSNKNWITFVFPTVVWLCVCCFCFNFLVSKIPALSFRVLENVKETHSILNHHCPSPK